MATLGMAKEVRNKRIQIRLTKSENELAERMALRERITVSDLFREHTLKEAPLLDDATKFQFIEKTAQTLSELNSYIKDSSQPEATRHLLTIVKAELIEARTLIANHSISSSL
ncbi:hypothetical protein Cri9333_4807 (plasmid) [Crinalium epipsammum PCC 9333]|uniref:Mobilization protein n=1 Tax=Crinalium epipsammum PCC 9333 TaxID=1173022 RepID=K9W5X6_9CYAN|nr:hypothetical protein [Crinalium epipsammum]AFZ15576.1 hypothetical protein Cri9333_4807 [Crinalium epipsammum PCC 9333]